MPQQFMIGDVDIDFADRSRALSGLNHVPAAIIRDGKIERHNTGVYFHEMPTDLLTNLCSIHYEHAEILGCYKFDLLNVHVYEGIKSEDHLVSLMSRELNWQLLQYPEFASQLIHVSNHTQLLSQLKPMSINDLAMILALIRPGKRHLIQRCADRGFNSIKDEIWADSPGSGYAFKHAHATSYAMLVKVHANLIIEQLPT